MEQAEQAAWTALTTWIDARGLLPRPASGSLLDDSVLFTRVVGQRDPVADLVAHLRSRQQQIPALP